MRGAGNTDGGGLADIRAARRCRGVDHHCEPIRKLVWKFRRERGCGALDALVVPVIVAASRAGTNPAATFRRPNDVLTVCPNLRRGRVTRPNSSVPTRRAHEGVFLVVRAEPTRDARFGRGVKKDTATVLAIRHGATGELKILQAALPVRKHLQKTRSRVFHSDHAFRVALLRRAQDSNRLPDFPVGLSRVFCDPTNLQVLVLLSRPMLFRALP